MAGPQLEIWRTAYPAWFIPGRFADPLIVIETARKGEAEKTTYLRLVRDWKAIYGDACIERQIVQRGGRPCSGR